MYNNNNRATNMVNACIDAIGTIAEQNDINIVDEDFIKDMALSSKFINAAFERQLGQKNKLHEQMSVLMNSI